MTGTKPTAVITGASRGIGRSIALRLAATYDIVAVARSADELESLRKEISSKGDSCRPIVLDITDPEAINAKLSGVEADVLVNNAGVGMLKPLLELTREEWHQMVNVNFNALFDVTRALLPGMVSRKRGHVIVIGSISGRSAFVGGTCYAATKHAVMAFTECLMLEVRDSGVKVSVVSPGSVATSFGSGDHSTWKLPPDAVADAVATVLDTPPNVLVHRVEVRTMNAPPKR